MDESTADKIVKSLLDYRGQSMIEDWTGQLVAIDVDYLKETINRDDEGEFVGIPKLIETLLGNNSQVLSIDGLNENVWDSDGDVDELTGVPEQMEWLASLDDMGSNDFSVVAFARDKDGIAPMVAWFVYKQEGRLPATVWKKLGVISNYWSIFQEYGIFSNRESEGDVMYEEAESRSKDSAWWETHLVNYRDNLSKEAGVIAFTVDFKGVAEERFFVKVLNWNAWPEALL